MAKAKNKENLKTKQGFEFIIEDKDVLVREHFGSFEIILTKKGALFKNYTGYRVFVAPYACGYDGNMQKTSLYLWLEYLVNFKKSIQGKEQEMFEETGVTNEDFLLGLQVMTEANMLRPMTVFNDIDEAQKEADRYMEWLAEQISIYNQSCQELREEDDEDIKENLLSEQRAIMEDEALSIITDKELYGGIGTGDIKEELPSE